MQYDIIVIGGGIVGLATAYQASLSGKGLKIAVIEKEQGLAKHQTGHNSGVIHSGIYYKPGSLKARNCIEGYGMMVDFCRENKIPFELCGKIIVATSQNELPSLETLFTRGQENGLEGLRKINGTEIRKFEPHASGIEGIYVPQTGIVDYKAVAAKMGQLFEQSGGKIFLGEKVTGIRKNEDSPAEVITETNTFKTRLIINCAGLYSDKIASLTTEDLDVRIIPFRGEYYKLKNDRKHLVNNLIYPVPDPAFPFLGVHFTRMVGGEVEAGPNAVFSFKKEGYSRTDFDMKEFLESIGWGGFRKVAAKYWKTGLGEYYRSFSKTAFTKALQKLIPEIKEEDLYPGGAGVRAQACDREGKLIDDFLIREKDFVINVLNAPSPAATSSLAIGKSICEMALKKL